MYLVGGPFSMAKIVAESENGTFYEATYLTLNGDRVEIVYEVHVTCSHVFDYRDDIDLKYNLL
jgi:hypothetical protein